MASETEQDDAMAVIDRGDAIGPMDGDDAIALIGRREAIRRVTALLGGIALVGGSGLLTGCKDRSSPIAKDGKFTAEDAAFLDEVADTILPDTPKSPGAKAAKVGPFMALMVTDTYAPEDQEVFRAGMRTLDETSQKDNGVGFMQATPQQRLALLQKLDQEQKTDSDARAARAKAREDEAKQKAGTATGVKTDTNATAGDKHMPDQRKENAPGAPDANAATAITKEPPRHYFRMMKELALLGYFTSEIGYTKAMRYQESPGRFDPCTPYTKGDPAWAPHA
jgi:hypothetical protein